MNDQVHITRVFCLLLVVSTTTLSSAERLLKKPNRALVRYQHGERCKRGREDFESCAHFVGGEAEVPVLRGDMAFFNFTATEVKGTEPVQVEGYLSSLHIEAFPAKPKHYYVAGLWNILKPENTGTQLWSLEGKKQRLERNKYEEKRLTYYTWYEATVWGEELQEIAKESEESERDEL